MTALVDTNILVYRFDPRFPEKQRAATALLRRGIAQGSLRVPQQAILEFVVAVTRRAWTTAAHCSSPTRHGVKRRSC